MSDNKDKDYSLYLPPMCFGTELKAALTTLPEYSEDIRTLDAGQRMLRLMDLYRIFIPTEMTVEIYHKLYTMTALSLKQKNTLESVRSLNDTHLHLPKTEFYAGTITGASSATIIGNSGIGKTSSIQKAAELLGPVIELKKPLQKIVPVVTVTCPFDSNYKGLLCQILLSLDEVLETNYYEKSQKSAANAQQLLSMVCKLCHLHVGVLIIDEIQFLVQHKSGTLLYKMILQLVNTSGIGVVLVGTNECLDYFSQAPQMARRTAGLRYQNLPYDEEFRKLAGTLFSMQYVTEKTELTEGILLWLYEHTSGNTASLMALIHDAQEIAIMRGTETLDIAALTLAYTKRLQMLREHIESDRRRMPATSARPREERAECISENVPEGKENLSPTIAELAKAAKTQGKNVLALLSHYYSVSEVSTV